MRPARENALLTSIIFASISAAMLTLCDGWRGSTAKAIEFQSLVRGLGLGCQCDLGHGATLFDPRLRGGDPELFSPSTVVGAKCHWHPMTIFPVPRPAPPIGPLGE